MTWALYSAFVVIAFLVVLLAKYWPKTRETKIEEQPTPSMTPRRESAYLGGWACDKHHCSYNRPHMDVCILCGRTVHPTVIFRLQDFMERQCGLVTCKDVVCTKTKFVQFLEEMK